MKPTSLIFLALSLILVFCGFMTCTVAKDMAEKQGIKIYDQEKNDDGDYVYTFNISEETVTKLNINFSDVDINVYGTDKQSYVELKNFDVNSYKTTLSGSSVTVEGDVGFLSSLVNMSGGGLQFKGLRHFILDKPDPERPKTVNVYLSKNAGIKTLNITLSDGNIFCENVSTSVDYFINAANSDVFFDKVNTGSAAIINISNGNASVLTSEIASLSVTIDTGNFTVLSNGAYSQVTTSYNLTAKEGMVKYNGVEIGTNHTLISPAPEHTITATIGKGNITATDDSNSAS